MATVLARVRADRERDVPAGMTSVYVQITAMHALADHDGEPLDCTPCSDSLRLLRAGTSWAEIVRMPSLAIRARSVQMN